MTKGEPPFTIGLEEEYLLVDKESRALIIEPPKSLIGEAEELLGDLTKIKLTPNDFGTASGVLYTARGRIHRKATTFIVDRRGHIALRQIGSYQWDSPAMVEQFRPFLADD